MTTPFCDACERDMSLVPAGVSKKTGKPYNAFYSCDKRFGGCGKTQNADNAPKSTFATYSSVAPGQTSAELDARLSVIERQLGIVPPHLKPKMDDLEEIDISEIPF